VSFLDQALHRGPRPVAEVGTRLADVDDHRCN
jgi:hypothetical protein